MSLYLIGYIITFLILYNCHPTVAKSPLSQYLHDMGVTTPFKCTGKKLLPSLLQSLIWPWPFVMVIILLALLPLLLIYAYFKKDLN